MIVYKRYVTIKESGEVVLSGLPFRPGQRIEVLLIAQDEQPTARLKELQALFQATQSLPQARAISEEEIAAEIAAYRTGK